MSRCCFLAPRLLDLGVEFQIIELRKEQDFLQQVAWLRGTTILVAAHGAALANLLFLPPGAAVYEVFPPKFLYQRFYRPMAIQLGLDYKEEQIDYEHSSASQSLIERWQNYTTKKCTSHQPCRMPHRSLNISPSTEKLANWIKQQIKQQRNRINKT